MTIPPYRLPPYIERGSGFGPTWKNVIQEAIAGNEQRFANWVKCRGVGDLSLGLRNSTDPLSDFRAILAMWRAHTGSLYPFRFRDWSDYTATNHVFANGTGSLTTFQLAMVYDPSRILLGTAGTLFYVRDITLPNLSTVTIRVNGVLQATPANYSISAAGLVTFTTAPAAASDIAWSGEFDVPVRFDTDQLPVIMQEADLASIRSIPIREVIGES